MSISHAIWRRASPWSSSQRTCPDVEYFLCFTATLTSSRLSNPPLYSEYQEFLHDTIIGFREKDWTFKQIAEWFRDNGYETVTGKRFYAIHVFSILKKKRIRDERLNALPGDRNEITSPLWVEYVERKYINSD
jgi:hypothetical protein